MKPTALHSAMRETQEPMRSRTAWLILGGVGLLLALSGPFGTIDLLSTPERLVYWPLLVVVTFFTGWFVDALVGQWPKAARAPALLRAGLSGVAIGVAVWVELLLLNRVFFGAQVLDDAAQLLTLLRDVVLISTIIAGLLIFAGPWNRRAPTPNTAPTPPRLLARLPFDKRGALVSLSVQDHYTEIVTTKGRALILLRLSDAIAETEGCAGLQVHRSHWVALDQVASARRDGAKAVLTMKDGREIPVSRSYVPAVKGAGLL